jgi:hypothetical protein
MREAPNQDSIKIVQLSVRQQMAPSARGGPSIAHPVEQITPQTLQFSQDQIEQHNDRDERGQNPVDVRHWSPPKRRDPLFKNWSDPREGGYPNFQPRRPE